MVLMIVVVLIGVYVGRMLFNDQANAAGYTSARNNDNVAASVANLAMQSIRYAPVDGAGETLNAAPPSYCWGSSSPSEITQGSASATAWCSTVVQPSNQSATRIVTVSVCLAGVSPSTCAGDPLVQVVVDYGDYQLVAGVLTTQCSDAAPATCGLKMAIVSWQGP
jgi:hypothetical protein